MYICILHIILCVSSIYLSILGYFHDQLLYLDTRVMGYIFGLIIAKLGDITPVFKFQKVQITCELFRSFYIYIPVCSRDLIYNRMRLHVSVHIHTVYIYIYMCVYSKNIYVKIYQIFVCTQIWSWCTCPSLYREPRCFTHSE